MNCNFDEVRPIPQIKLDDSKHLHLGWLSLLPTKEMDSNDYQADKIRHSIGSFS